MYRTSQIQWKHQRLNNGCAWTCLAILLSRWSINIEVEQLIARSIIPYLIEYCSADNAFRAGMQVQHTEVFNSITQPFGLEHIDQRFSGWDSFHRKAVQLLGEGIPFMTCIATRSIPLSAYDILRKSGGESRGHAVVIFGYDDEEYLGLDPDGGLDRSGFYNFDSIKDKVQFRIKPDDLRNGLERKPGKSYLIGWQKPAEPGQFPEMSDYLNISRESVRIFRNRMKVFIEEINGTAHLSHETFMERIHSMIKPITLDLVTAIETIEQKSKCQLQLSDELLKLRKVFQEHQSYLGSRSLSDLDGMTDRICILLTKHIDSFTTLPHPTEQ